MNEEKKYSLLSLLRQEVDKLRADKSKVQSNGSLNHGVVLDNLFESLKKGQIGSDFGDLDSFIAFVRHYIPPGHVTFKGVPRDDVISMAHEYAHFDSGGALTPLSLANILEHVQGHEDFSEEKGGGGVKNFLNSICFLEMYDMKKDQREVNGIFYVPSQGKDFSVYEPSAKAALEEEEKKRDSELTSPGKTRSQLCGGARARIKMASKAHDCDGFPDVCAVKNWIHGKKKKTAEDAGGAGASGAGAGGSN